MIQKVAARHEPLDHARLGLWRNEKGGDMSLFHNVPEYSTPVQGAGEALALRRAVIKAHRRLHAGAADCAASLPPTPGRFTRPRVKSDPITPAPETASWQTI